MPIELGEELRERLALALNEFAAPDGQALHTGAFLRIPIAPQLMPVPVIATLVLEQLGARYLPRGDKTAWEIAFRYRGINCTLALQKFGLRLYADAEAIPEEDAGVVRVAARWKTTEGRAPDRKAGPPSAC